MTNYIQDKLKDHIGHNIVYIVGRNTGKSNDISVECEDCDCIIASTEDLDKNDV